MQKDDFEKEVLKSLPSLHLYALKLTKDEYSADDLLQDSLLRAFCNVERCYDASCFNVWMYTIIKHSFINECKRNLRYKAIKESFNNEECIYFDEATDNISVDEIMGVIDSFSEDYRNAFHMHISGYKYHEIAKILSIPLGTVKSRIFHVRKSLRERLLCD